MRATADFSAYRRADVFFHLGIAEASHSARLVAAMTEVQGKMSELIAHIAHPLPVLARSNEQHAALVAALERRDGWTAARVVREHLKGTEQVLAGLMP
jgi:DNA-binding GntR family transcriptional regulator